MAASSVKERRVASKPLGGHDASAARLRQTLHDVLKRDYVAVGNDWNAHVLPHLSAYVSIRQHTSAYVSIRQDTSGYVSIRHSIRQHASAYVSRRARSTLRMIFQSARGALGPLCSRVRPWIVSTDAPASAQSLAYCSVRLSSSNLEMRAKTSGRSSASGCHLRTLAY